MKIRLELEVDDVRDMVTDYFSSRGFSIKNLDEICDLFVAAYPTGIVVEAQPLATNIPLEQMPSRVAAQAAPAETAAPLPPTENEPAPATVKRNPRLGFSDLMDPTVHGNVPTRDELLQETQRELQQILQMSKSLEKT